MPKELKAQAGYDSYTHIQELKLWEGVIANLLKFLGELKYICSFVLITKVPKINSESLNIFNWKTSFWPKMGMLLNSKGWKSMKTRIIMKLRQGLRQADFHKISSQGSK